MHATAAVLALLAATLIGFGIIPDVGSDKSASVVTAGWAGHGKLATRRAAVRSRLRRGRAAELRLIQRRLERLFVRLAGVRCSGDHVDVCALGLQRLLAQEWNRLGVDVR